MILAKGGGGKGKCRAPHRGQAVCSILVNYRDEARSRPEPHGSLPTAGPCGATVRKRFLGEKEARVDSERLERIGEDANNRTGLVVSWGTIRTRRAAADPRCIPRSLHVRCEPLFALGAGQDTRSHGRPPIAVPNQPNSDRTYPLPGDPGNNPVGRSP